MVDTAQGDVVWRAVLAAVEHGLVCCTDVASSYICRSLLMKRIHRTSGPARAHTRPALLLLPSLPPSLLRYPKTFTSVDMARHSLPICVLSVLRVRRAGGPALRPNACMREKLLFASALPSLLGQSSLRSGHVSPSAVRVIFPHMLAQPIFFIHVQSLSHPLTSHSSPHELPCAAPSCQEF